MEDAITPPMSGGGCRLSLYAMKAKCRASHREGSGSTLMAAPPGKGVITANENKGASDMNWSPVLWPLWLLGYCCFHVTVLDDFSKAGGIQAPGRGVSLFLMHPELQPASLRKPLFPCLAFSYLPVIIPVTISQVAGQAAV